MIDFSFSGIEVFLGVLLIIGLIFLYIRARKSSFESILSGKAYKTLDKKHEEVDVLRKRSTITKIGMLSSLLLVFLFINWTTERPIIDVFGDYQIETIEELEVVPPRTSGSYSPPPPPSIVPIVPQEVIVDKPNVEVPKVEEKIETPPSPPEISKTTVNNENSSSTSSNSTSANNAPSTNNEESFPMIVEQMPRFPGCEHLIGDNKEKNACAKDKLALYIKSNLSYPLNAQKNKIEGEVYIQFVVDLDGSITRIKVVKDPGSGLGDAAKALVESMNNMPVKWTPGRQGNKPVRVRYTMPVKFKLNEIKRG
jgi:protein TonB